MKFFSIEWHRGDMPDAQAELVPDAYSRHISDLQLPPAIAALSRVNLHDAYILSVDHDPNAARLTLRFRCGDQQQGYADVTLTFLHVVTTLEDVRMLQRMVRPANVEVLYDEIDRACDHFEYRLLLWPYEEVAIGFGDVEITVLPVADRGTT